MPNFEVFNRRAVRAVTKPIVGIQSRGYISLNNAAFQALNEPAAVELLYDRGEQLVGFRAASPDKAHTYPVRKQSKTASYLVAGQAFCSYYGIKLLSGATQRFEALMIGDVLAVDLRQGVTATSRRSAKASSS